MKKYILIIAISSMVAIFLTAKFVLIGKSNENPKLEPIIAKHPAILNPEVSGRRVVKRIELLEPKPAFNFELTDMDRTLFQLEDYRGKLVLIGFIYTTCPDVCGILTMHFRRIQREFADILDKDLVLVFITTDPKRDTPERVAAYTKGFDGRWHFLTGTESQLREVWDQYRVFVKPKPEVELVYHSYMVVLLDRQGLIRYRYIGLVDPEEVIVKDIHYLLTKGGM
ncbi:MAG: SCO family protein [bacterium]